MEATSHGVHVRWMIRADIAEVLDIEQDSFEFPWSRDTLIDCLRKRNCIGITALEDDYVAGYAVYELHYRRLQLLNLAVHVNYRRSGVATAIIDKLKSKLSAQRRNRILTEVRESNLAAQKFFRAQGFRAVSILRGFYDDTTEDAYLFQYRFKERGEDAAQQGR
jgi:ribosomal-protein-alanine N-acetyltransferase